MKYPVLACSLVGTVAVYHFAKPQAGDAGGRVDFTPHAPIRDVRPGLTPLGLSDDRDGFLFVPQKNSAREREPLLILLHGATQRARLFARLTPSADSFGVVLLAPDSRGMTWDAVRGDFGPDVQFLKQAITAAFDRANIDSCRVVIAGFSDGASYALSLGIRNARKFHGVVAFSPGFIVPLNNPGRTPVFVRHGTRDQILPIEAASRPIVAALRRANFAVDYAEFDGPHTVRPADASDALRWVNRRSCSDYRNAGR